MSAERDGQTPSDHRQHLLELAVVFSKLGLTAFGGPVAHIAMMEEEVVQRRQWLSREQLLDLLGMTQLIPGPNSTELAIHIGMMRAGWLGLIIAGSCFILPAMLMVWGLAAMYVHYQTLPEAGWLLQGAKPVILAIIVHALWKFGTAVWKNWTAIAASLLTVLLFFLGVNEILLLLVSGCGLLLIETTRSLRLPNHLSLWFLPLPLASLPLLPAVPPTWERIFFSFLKIGSVLYGSGYVLLAFVQEEFVTHTHWLTSQQLLDAIAIGQFTPGPVFTTATFIGYLLAGHAGAIAATVGIFLPAFVMVALVHPWAEKLRRSAIMARFLDGLNAASLGLMAAVTWELGRATLLINGQPAWLALAIAVLSLIVLFRVKVNSAWLVLGGSEIGLLAHLAHLL